jgi:diaminohydroxyphosphoribosylaminopyrimidine deaminase / 5-amino-6-(5-phosphoribosylamino)uracil reductase
MDSAHSPFEMAMNRCIRNAAPWLRTVAPNPAVGCVILSAEGVIVAEGAHRAFGGPHAEIDALEKLDSGLDPSELTLVVSLEPCCHFGKTPPCTDSILASGIRKVVIGAGDPFPKVAGGGIARLIAAGIEVVTGVLARECTVLNKRFFIRHKLDRPYVTLKWAETTDGFIARSDGTSKWISSELSRKRVHQWRSEEQSILVGSGTAIQDNPRLTARLDAPTHNPLRVIVAPHAKLPSSLHVFDGEAPTVLFTARRDLPALPSVRYVTCEEKDKNLLAPLKHLAQQGISSVFVEGGAEILQSFIHQELWDEARVFVSPAKFGNGILAPVMTTSPTHSEASGPDELKWFYHPKWEDRLGLRSRE